MRDFANTGPFARIGKPLPLLLWDESGPLPRSLEMISDARNRVLQR